MHTFVRLLTISLLLALSSAAAAKEAKAHAQADAKADAKAEAKTPQVVQGEALAKKIQALYKKVQDFSASFSQTYTYTAFDRTDVRKGTVEVKRPGLVRWEYSEPEKKLLLLDGKDFWQYVPEDNAVSVKRGLKGNEA
ncbi:MAG: outer membrane lipoprotein carrier protein LolA, partial [Deltaproteobacteria bacterium]|nr:outer membrane lipoprotein carrier protein LolA [Deltaproteobacteria bacterium]